MPSALVPNTDWQKRELQGINASASFFSLLDANADGRVSGRRWLTPHLPYSPPLRAFRLRARSQRA